MKHLFLNLIVLLATTFAFAQNVPSYVPTNGLVGWYPFNGNANDESLAGTNGNVKGAVLTFDRFGNPNKAFEFNSNAFANIDLGINQGINSITNDFTFSFWINKISSDANNVFSSYSNQNGSYWRFIAGLYGDSLQAGFLIGGGAGTWQGASTPINSIQNNNWYHLIVTRNNNNFRIYINSLLSVNSSLSSSAINNPTTPFATTKIGYNFPSSGGTEYFDGKIDDLGFWNRALTEQEITNLYNGNICYKTVSVTDTLRISTLAGFNSLPQEFGTVKVFPNPTNDLLNISIDKPNSNYTIKIMDNTSKAVYTSTMNSNSLQVNLNQFSSKGLYLIQILDNTNKVLDVRKLILE